MAPKRAPAPKTEPGAKRPRSDAAPKAAATFSAAAPSVHPTLQRLQEVLNRVNAAKFMAEVHRAKPAAGIEEFDLSSYKSAMKSHQEYTCIVPATSVSPFVTAHLQLIPSWCTVTFRPQIGL